MTGLAPPFAARSEHSIAAYHGLAWRSRAIHRASDQFSSRSSLRKGESDHNHERVLALSTARQESTAPASTFPDSRDAFPIGSAEITERRSLITAAVSGFLGQTPRRPTRSPRFPVESPTFALPTDATAGVPGRHIVPRRQLLIASDDIAAGTQAIATPPDGFNAAKPHFFGRRRR